MYNHQKAVPKYFTNTDALTDPKLLETLENDHDKSSCDGFNKQITGIKDGSYKALINLWPGQKDDSLYLSKYKPGKTVLLDIDWTTDIEKGYMNKGKMRIRQQDINILGNNLKDQMTRNYDSYIDDLSDITSFSYLSTSAKEDSNILYVNDTSVFSINSLLIIDTVLYSQVEKSPLLSKQLNNITEMNIITGID